MDDLHESAHLFAVDPDELEKTLGHLFTETLQPDQLLFACVEKIETETFANLFARHFSDMLDPQGVDEAPALPAFARFDRIEEIAGLFLFEALEFE